MQARQLGNLQIAAVCGHLDHHQETGKIHHQIGERIKDGPGVAGRAHAEDTDQHIAGVGNGRIAQQSL